MSPTIQQLIIDAKRLAERLKDHDTSASELLSQTQNIHKQIEAMREYRDDVNELNDLARHQPHKTLAAGIQFENHKLKELQVENNELKAALEEHQNVLELVMSKYRQQVGALIQQGRKKAPATLSHQECNQKFQEQSQKIAEILALMNRVAVLDEQGSVEDVFKMTRLAIENKGLRDLLMISSVPHGSEISSMSLQSSAVPNSVPSPDAIIKLAEVNLQSDPTSNALPPDPSEEATESVSSSELFAVLMAEAKARKEALETGVLH